MREENLYYNKSRSVDDENFFMIPLGLRQSASAFSFPGRFTVYSQ